MRRAIVVVTALAGLGLPPAAGADVLDTYQELAARRLSPAPLVPTTVPRSLRPYDRTVAFGPSLRRSGYALRIANTGPEAVVLLTGGNHKNVRALRRDYRFLGYGSPRRIRVRGRRGYLFVRRGAPVTRALAWVEGGVVY